MGKPKIRFKGFDDDWEQRKFGDLADYKKGPFGSALKKDIFVPKSDTTVKVYEQQNAINKDWHLERYFITEKYANKLSGFRVEGGDIIVSCAGTIGETYELPMDAEPGIINQALMKIKVKESIVNKKMFNILFTNMIDDFTRVHSNGSAIKNIPPFSDLKPMEVFVPEIDEQNKISFYFSNLDRLITLHQRKCDETKKLKKYMLQKMFPQSGQTVPEIRFSGFTDVWEQRKLGDVLERRIEQRQQSKEYPRLAFASGQGVIPLSERKTNNREQLTKDEYTKKYLVTELNDIVYNPANVKYGAIDRNKCGRGLISPIYVTFTTSEISGFIERIVTSHDFQQRALRFEEGTVTKRQSVNPEDLVTLDILVASKREEQQKIATYFDSLDNLITLHQQKCDELRNIKKFMLQNMFA